VRVAALVVAGLAVVGCQGEKEPELIQFNNKTDVLQIDVVDKDVFGDPEEIELLSNTSTVVVGVATVDPGSAPVGTDHQLIVQVDDTWQDVVTLVTVVAAADNRGKEEYELRQDSADHGVWVVTLTSIGDEGETRTDEMTIRLWHPDDVPDVSLPEE
jgi:uncharacterized iron-regulated membrane protein